tara:strand:+ start:939 stop:1490 length:552 start_codon:yes stop_codon:yes gene_type:complete
MQPFVLTCPQALKKDLDTLRRENEALIKYQAYNSKCTKEFEDVRLALEFLPEKSLILPYIEQLFFHALINQRKAEYGIMCHQMSVGLLGIRTTEHESLYQLYYLLVTTGEFIQKQIWPETPLAVRRTREDTADTVALGVKENIEAMFILLDDPTLQESGEKENAVMRLSLCNKNLNKMMVVMN